MTANTPFLPNGTSHVTLNQDVTAQDLDATTSFEGPEKLLEVWLCPSENDLPHSVWPRGLLSVPRADLEGMLDLVHCTVLSVLEFPNVHAYLLSESSMFVFPHKIVLKTCGTTTLLLGLRRLLELAAEAGFPHAKVALPGDINAAATPYRVFYSRKNFLFPHQQKEPHRSWGDEVDFLDKMFLGGSAYMIGKMNGEHWYLYITEPRTELTPPATPDRESAKTETQHLQLPNGNCNGVHQDDESVDQTLEILMTDLDEFKARQFYNPDAEGEASMSPEDLNKHSHELGNVVTEKCGLADVYPAANYPDARIDSYLFSPCGYSANGVVPTPSSPEKTHYWTVHVTPEPHCSYASFETNVPSRGLGRDTVDEIVQKIIDIFNPGRFSVTLFEEARGEEDTTMAKQGKRIDSVKGYRRVDRIVHDLDGYDLVFRHFVREDWKGGARLGENAQ
jgi:S-adenosylmethionine decarboxylase